MPRSADSKLADDQPKTSASFFGRILTKRQKLTKGVLWSALIVTALGVGVPPLAQSLAADEAAPPAERSQAAMPVQVMVATPSDSYSVQRAYTGTLVAARRSELAFERPGKVIRLLVDEGDRVKAGQLLAELDRRRLIASKQTVEAELAEAKAVLAELVKGPRDEAIATAAAEVRTLQADRDVAERNLRRRRQLVETSAISREEYDESFFATKAAAARVVAAEKKLEELETGTRVERVDAQKARVAALQASLADVNHEIEDTQLVAPFAGSITQRRMDEGAIAPMGTPVFDLIEDNRLEAWVGVPVESASRLNVGDPVKVVINRRQHDARVKSLRSELDPTTRTQNVVLEVLPAEGERLVAGQVARILLAETINKSGIWAPTSALTPHRRGLWAVYVVDGDGPNQTIAKRDVELLHTEGDRSFVRGTLQAGDRIVVAGGHKVVAGQRVAIVNR
ncbi:MAG: efflux RND transporter periplasmic adaptor subunit [Planctomycetota bacterium]